MLMSSAIHQFTKSIKCYSLSHSLAISQQVLFTNNIHGLSYSSIFLGDFDQRLLKKDGHKGYIWCKHKVILYRTEEYWSYPLLYRVSLGRLEPMQPTVHCGPVCSVTSLSHPLQFSSVTVNLQNCVILLYSILGCPSNVNLLKVPRLDWISLDHKTYNVNV